MQNFENYLCERNDTIDNAAYQLIGVLTAEDPGASLEDDPATPNWDMAIIGEVVDAVKEKRSAIPAILSTVMRCLAT